MLTLCSAVRALSLALLAAFPVLVPAQAGVPLAPVYDIVSIHQNKTGGDSGSINSTDSSFTAENISLINLLTSAYPIKQDLVFGLPRALQSAQFDITAKISEPAEGKARHLTDEQFRAMLVAMLTDRFHLKAHIETKDLPVYELIVLPGGPKFKSSGSDGTHGGMEGAPGKVTGNDFPMSSLAYVLSGRLHRTVLDKTALTGGFDLTLTWTPDDEPDPQASAPPPLFTALQEQLGLKLRPGKGPVDTLVIDQMEMPSEN